MDKRIARAAVITLVLVANALGREDCKTWFSKSELKPGPGCLAKCTSLPTGMDTFFCPQACKEFCNSQSVGERALGRVLYYPGLNSPERHLVRTFPKEAISVFVQKEKAESATMRAFDRDTQDDESDAFRHFVWAALLAKELGPDLAKKFLDAHEAGGKSDDASRAMDLANNRAGLLAAERLKREGKLTQEQIEREALGALQNQTLVVLKARGGSK